MKYRKRMSRRHSNKKWRKGLKSRRKNNNSTVPRGGIKL